MMRLTGIFEIVSFDLGFTLIGYRDRVGFDIFPKIVEKMNLGFFPNLGVTPISLIPIVVMESHLTILVNEIDIGVLTATHQRIFA